MGFYNRPYVGGYKLTGKRLVQYTPDCLVYVNGDTSLPGCHKCNGRIDLQQFITSVSVDASTQAGGASGSVSLSIPRAHGNSIFRDNNFLISMGLEVHIYMRGYFPVKGMYAPREQNSGQLENIGGLNLSDMVAHPYYHVFHGVITSVGGPDYSGGFWHASFSSQDMLHFWQYQPIATATSKLASIPRDQPLSANDFGHRYMGMSPYSIIYDLYRSTMGSPGAVGRALLSEKEKSNVGAVSAIDPSKSLFSMAQLYWEKRFQTRINTLKMFGASGQLFNSAQQAYLTQWTSNPSRDGVPAGVNALAQVQLKDPTKGPNPKTPFKKASALNFLRVGADGALEKGIDVFEGGAGPVGGSLGYNIAAIHAYTYSADEALVQGAGEFETTYETKIDIANRVTEVTGYEFFQDVDGDFVFKPPFYNMDVSGNRIYRIEPIDIISFSPASSEPAATYMKAKGGIQASMVLGAEGDVGVSARYVDFRLVSQFGYRAGSFETSYYTEPTALYYAAINRLDLMNIGMFTASVVIPLRPEMRPGYPVYFPGSDSYYYITGINHSFQYGGQCTTSLTLEARRKKFYAPGNPDKRGVDSIELGNPTLPPKPLEVISEDGQPSLSGFPNVVMALDPDLVNPLFYLVGFKPENVGSPKFVEFMLKSLSVLGELEVDIDATSGTLTPGLDPGTRVKLRVDQDSSISFQPQGATEYRPLVSGKDFKGLASRYSSTARKSPEVVRNISDKSTRIGDLRLRRQNVETDGSLSEEERTARKAELDKRILDLESSLNAELGNVAQAGGKTNNVEVLLFILQAVRGAYLDGYSSEITNPNSTSNLLEYFNDRKSSISNTSIEGSYRYYSSSHPNAKEQGQKRLTVDETTGVLYETGGPEALESPISTRGYVRSPRVRTGGVVPEAEFGNIQVTAGIRIYQRGSLGGTSVVPTKSITAISEAIAGVTRETKSTVETAEPTFEFKRKELEIGIGRSLFSIAQKLEIVLGDALAEGAGGTTVGDVYADRVAEIQEAIQLSIAGPDSDEVAAFVASDKVVDPFEDPDVPNLSLGEKLADPFRVFSDKRENTVIGAWEGAVGITNPLKKAKKAANLLGSNFSDVASAIFQQRFLLLLERYGNPNNNLETGRSQAKDKAYKQLVDHWRILTRNIADATVPAAVFDTKAVDKGSASSRLQTPVFPVSDHKGYEVVGSYRYGRGLSVEPGGTLDSLLSETDAFRYSSLEDVERLVQSLQVDNEGTVSVKGLTVEEMARLATDIGALSEKGAADVLSEIKAGTRDKTQLENQFSNWAANSLDGPTKSSPGNAAFTLADLQVFADKRACDCRGAESDIALVAFGQDGFVPVAPNLDKATQAQAARMAQDSGPWSETQEAYRGRVLERRNSGIAERAQALGTTVRGLVIGQDPDDG